MFVDDLYWGCGNFNNAGSPFDWEVGDRLNDFGSDLKGAVVPGYFGYELLRRDGVVCPYRYRIPSNYDPSKPVGVLASIERSMTFLEGYPADFDALAEEQNWIPLNFDGLLTPETYEASVAAFAQVIDDLRTTYSIDMDRIFTFGWSGSGFSAQRLAVVNPGLVAAAGLFVPNFGEREQPQPDTHYPIIAFQGLHDGYQLRLSSWYRDAGHDGDFYFFDTGPQPSCIRLHYVSGAPSVLQDPPEGLPDESVPPLRIAARLSAMTSMD